MSRFDSLEEREEAALRRLDKRRRRSAHAGRTGSRRLLFAGALFVGICASGVSLVPPRWMPGEAEEPYYCDPDDPPERQIMEIVRDTQDITIDNLVRYAERCPPETLVAVEHVWESQPYGGVYARKVRNAREEIHPNY